MISGPDQLEDLVPADEAVAGKEDPAHGAAAQPADDFIIGVIRQLGGKSAGWLARALGNGFGMWQSSIRAVSRPGCVMADSNGLVIRPYCTMF